jgi:hypothetical protein
MSILKINHENLAQTFPLCESDHSYERYFLQYGYISCNFARMKFCEHTLSLNLLPSRLALPQQPADSIWSDLKALVVPRGRF